MSINKKYSNKNLDNLEEIFCNMNKKVKQSKYTNLMPKLDKSKINNSIDGLKHKLLQREKKKSHKYTESIDSTNASINHKNSFDQKDFKNTDTVNIHKKNSLNINDIINKFPILNTDSQELLQYITDQNNAILLLEKKLIDSMNEIQELKFGKNSLINLQNENDKLIKENKTINNYFEMQKRDYVSIYNQKKTIQNEINVMTKENSELKNKIKEFEQIANKAVNHSNKINSMSNNSMIGKTNKLKKYDILPVKNISQNYNQIHIKNQIIKNNDFNVSFNNKESFVDETNEGDLNRIQSNNEGSCLTMMKF